LCCDIFQESQAWGTGRSTYMPNAAHSVCRQNHDKIQATESQSSIRRRRYERSLRRKGGAVTRHRVAILPHSCQVALGMAQVTTFASLADVDRQHDQHSTYASTFVAARGLPSSRQFQGKRVPGSSARHSRKVGNEASYTATVHNVSPPGAATGSPDPHA